MSLYTTTRARELCGIAYAAALRCLRDRDKASDASQDAMLALCQAKNKGVRFERTTAFVRHLARWKAIDLLRRNKRYRTLDESEAAQLSEHGISPRDEAIGKMLMDILRSELELLPAFEKKVYELVATQALSTGEIAKLTNRTPSAINSVYFRAKQRLGHLGLSARGGQGQS